MKEVFFLIILLVIIGCESNDVAVMPPNEFDGGLHMPSTYVDTLGDSVIVTSDSILTYKAVSKQLGPNVLCVFHIIASTGSAYSGILNPPSYSLQNIFDGDSSKCSDYDTLSSQLQNVVIGNVMHPNSRSDTITYHFFYSNFRRTSVINLP